MTCRTHIAAIAIALAAAAFADAGTFEPRLVSSKAKYVAFIDLEHARNSAIGDRIMERILADPGYRELEAALVEYAGFMPANDIRDATIWGEQYGADARGLLVLRAAFDAKRLRTTVGLAQQFHSDTYGEHELLTWLDEGKGNLVHGCLYDKDTILMSPSVESLKRGIDVAGDAHESIEGDKGLPRPAPEDQKTWGFASAIDLPATPDAANNPVTRNLQSAYLEVGQDVDKKITTARLVGVAPTKEKAQMLLNLSIGARAMLQLAATPATKPAETPEDRSKRATFEAFHELLAATTVSADDATITATLNLADDRAASIADVLLDARDLRVEHNPAKP